MSIPRDQLQALFRIFDVEQTGCIDARELKAGLRALGVPATVSQVKELLAMHNKSATDAISFDDFCAIAGSCLPPRDSPEALRQVFHLFGGADLGYISLDHLRSICDELGEEIDDADLQQMIAEADRDGDGRVTFEDFCRIMTLKFDALADDDDNSELSADDCAPGVRRHRQARPLDEGRRAGSVYLYPDPAGRLGNSEIGRLIDDENKAPASAGVLLGYQHSAAYPADPRGGGAFSASSAPSRHLSNPAPPAGGRSWHNARRSQMYP